MGQPKEKEGVEEFNGRMIVDYLMNQLNLNREQSVAELLEIEKRTLENWYDKSYEQLNKRSARLKALYDAIYKFETSYIPPSDFMYLLKETPVGDFRCLMDAIISEPDNSLLDAVVKMFTDRYFFDITDTQDKESLAKSQLSESDKERIRKKFRK